MSSFLDSFLDFFDSLNGYLCSFYPIKYLKSVKQILTIISP